MTPPKLNLLNASQVMGRVSLRPASRDEILDLVIASAESVEPGLIILDRDLDLGHRRTIELLGCDRDGIPVFILVSGEEESEDGLFLRAMDVPHWITETQPLLERVFEQTEVRFDGPLRILVIGNGFSPEICVRVENLLGFTTTLIKVQCVVEGGRLGLLSEVAASSAEINEAAGLTSVKASHDREERGFEELDSEDPASASADPETLDLPELDDKQMQEELLNAPFLQGEFDLPPRESDLATYQLPPILQERDRERAESEDPTSSSSYDDDSFDPEDPGTSPHERDPLERGNSESSRESASLSDPDRDEAPTAPLGPSSPALGPSSSGVRPTPRGVDPSEGSTGSQATATTPVQTLTPTSGRDPMEELMEDGARRISALSDRIQSTRSKDLVRFLLDGRILAEIRHRNDELEILTDPTTSTGPIRNANEFESGLNRIITKFFRLEEKGTGTSTPPPPGPDDDGEESSDPGEIPSTRDDGETFRPAKLTEEELAELFAEDPTDAKPKAGPDERT